MQNSNQSIHQNSSCASAVIPTTYILARIFRPAAVAEPSSETCGGGPRHGGKLVNQIGKEAQTEPDG